MGQLRMLGFGGIWRVNDEKRGIKRMFVVRLFDQQLCLDESISLSEEEKGRAKLSIYKGPADSHARYRQNCISAAEKTALLTSSTASCLPEFFDR